MDPDGSISNITWQWASSPDGSSNWATISGAASATYTPVAGDVGSYLRALASYVDGHGDDKTAFAVSANLVQAAPPDPNDPVFPETEDGQRSVRENMAIGSNVGAPFRATDADNDRLTYAAAGSDGFEIDESSGQLTTKTELDHEGRPTHSVTVTATDPSNLSASLSVTITVEDVDEAPSVTGPTTVSDYEENDTAIVALYSASDPDDRSVAITSWSLNGTDAGDFTINEKGELRFASPPDYEGPADSGGNNHYEVIVAATDSNSQRGELHLDVIVKNVDETPVLDGPDAVDDFPENSANSREVARYTASDPERARVTLSLASGDTSAFALASDGVLTFTTSPGYEQKSRYQVTVRAAAGIHTGNSATLKPVTVNIQNLEEQGTVSLSAVQPQAGTLLTATLDDDDGPTGTTWQWYRTSSRGSTGSEITNATSATYRPDADDVGSYLRVVASYDDGHGDDKIAIAVSVNRVQEAPPTPEPPVFPADGDYDRSTRENTRAGSNLGAPVTATDANNDRLTYSIPASDYFEIDASSGQLRTKVELDHEVAPTHTVSVTATDPGNDTGNVDVTITVENVDETPVVTGEASPEFEENAVGNVATYSATDPDRKGIELFVTGTDSEDFTLSGGGILTFSQVPHFEEPADSNRDNRYQVTIEAREQNGGTSVGRLNITVSVTNVDEPGMVQANAEEPRVGQTLRLEVEDEDGGESVGKWKWEKGVPNSPCGTVDNPTVTNWETISGAGGGSYTPTAADQGHCIRVTTIYNDRAGTGRSEQFLTTETVEFGPFFDSDRGTGRVDENSLEGSSIGNFRARHSNSGETLNYSLGGSDARFFTVDPATGQLRTSDTPLDYETQPGHEAEVEITATDTQITPQTASITVTIDVTDECRTAGEPPCAPSVSSASATGLRVSWSAPSAESHDLRYRESGSGASWTEISDVGTGRSYTITQLTTGTSYEAQVSTINGRVFSDWSQSGTGTPRSIPPPPPPPPPKKEEETTPTTTSTGGGGGGGGGFVPTAPPQPPRPATNFQGVGQLFQPLTRNSTLARVWRLIDSSQRWLFYDPNPQFAPFNTLRTINLASDPPAVVAINVTRSQQFRGVPLFAGWNFVPVTAEPLAAQPGSRAQPVEQLFRPLAGSGALNRVWWLDSRTQEWKFYDPDPDLAAFNTLTTINLTANPPVVAAVSVSRQTEFRGRTLYPGWNYIVLR